MVSKDSVGNESSINDNPTAELIGGTGSLWRAGLLTRGQSSAGWGVSATDASKPVLCRSHIPQALKDIRS